MAPNGVSIHSTALVSPKAELGRNVRVEPYAIIGDRVQVGDDTRVMHHAVIERNTRLGAGCTVFPFASLGTDPQDITFKDEETFLEIGGENTIREFTTINRGTAKGGGCTLLGSHNYLMAYVHIGHDCRVGNHTILINGATLAGHVVVEDHVVISAYSAVHQFARIGRNAYIGGYSIVTQDILPFAKVAQRRTSFSFFGPNSIGMMRNGYNREFIERVKDMFRLIFHSDLNLSQAIKKIEEEFGDAPEARIIIDFVSQSKRGILKNFLSDEQ